MENMNELYSDIILEHNQCQENKHPLDGANLSEHGHNCLLYTSPSPRD